MPQARLTVANRLSELPRVTEWIRRFAEAHCVPSAIVDRLDLCSAELVTNIVSYAHADDAVHDIVLRLDLAGDAITLEIEDDGRPFDPREAAPPRSVAGEDRPVGGWGIALVRRFSDDLRYQRDGGRNRVTVVHHRPT